MQARLVSSIIGTPLAILENMFVKNNRRYVLKCQGEIKRRPPLGERLLYYFFFFSVDQFLERCAGLEDRELRAGNCLLFYLVSLIFENST